MGIVIDQRASDVKFAKLRRNWRSSRRPRRSGHRAGVDEIRVLRGGPVDTGRGFVLHSSHYRRTTRRCRSTARVCLTATLDILRAIAQGEWPKKAVLALGCAGWSAGQLESEILANAWLTGPADPALLFGDDFAGKYDHALGLLGARAAHLSSEAGHA